MKNTSKKPSKKPQPTQMRNKRRGVAAPTYASGASKAPKKAASPVRAERVAVVREPMPKEKRVFILFVSLLCVFAILFATLGSLLLADVLGEVKYGSLYESINLKKYVGFGRSNYTGKTIDLSTYYRAPYTLADMDDYIEELRISKRTEKLLGAKQSPIGLGDDIQYYVIGVYKDGNPILTNDFAGMDYSTPYYSTVGTGIFSKNFDEALIALSLSPIDTYRAIRLSGTVGEGDVIAVSYTAVKAQKYNNTDPSKAEWGTDTVDSTLYTNGSSQALGQARVDLSEMLSSSDEADKRLAQSLIDNCKEIGEPFEFVIENHLKNKVGGYDTVKYTATVHFVAEEQYKDVVFTLPEDYFAEDAGYGEEYTSLNGKELTMRLIVAQMNDYDVPEANAAFFKSIEGFTTDKTSDAEVRDAFKTHALKTLNDGLSASLKSSYITQAYATIVSPLFPSHFGIAGTTTYNERYPEGAIDEAGNRAYNELLQSYYASGTTTSFDNYVISVIGSQTGSSYSSANDAITAMAEQYVAYDIFMYYVFDKENLRITSDMLEEEYKEYVDELIKSYSTSDEKGEYNEEYFVKERGEDTLYKEARRRLVYTLVGEFLLENNTVSYQ